jgi:hypothetical protein
VFGSVVVPQIRGVEGLPMTLIASSVYLLLVAVVMYWIPIRLWYTRWGVTDAELVAALPGDDTLASPNYGAMLAVTIDATPEYIWPWLLQMGKGRGGLYSYDWVDRLFGYLDGPSAEVILPQFQHLRVGDVVPVGTPDGCPVVAVCPYEALVLGGETDQFAWVWQLVMTPVSRHRTRLISRSRGRVPRTIKAMLLMLALEPAAFIMTRKMLLGIQRRAEGLQRLSAGDTPPVSLVAH